MFLKLFIEEFKRHKVINITLAIFIVISAMLLSSATYISLVLNKGINELTSKGMTPHYIQMHAGELDEQALDDFNATLDYIEYYQLQEMITITPNTMFIKDDNHSEVNGVMDMSFVTQNESFDFLLNTDNEIASVKSGEIGVPVYYKARYNLNLGDPIQLKLDDQVYNYQISVFTRDSQMNSSLISSKRFLLSETDFTMLQSEISEREYMIEYIFTSTDKVSEFKTMYQEANLPDSGPAVGYRLFRLMNALTDGIVILILLVISASLTIIGLLCLRYSLISNIEEDVKQIGVLKAIGITAKGIKKIYFRKFIFLTSISITIGYALSFFTNKLFMRNIKQYMGNVTLSIFGKFIPIIGALLVMGIVLFTVRRILRKIKTISVIETITNQNILQKNTTKKAKPIKKRKAIPLPFTLGVNSLKQNKKSYRLMMFIFVVAAVMMILPLSVYKTFGATDFIEYMGVGYSDLRLDIRNTEDTSVSDSIIQYLDQDENIKEYAMYKTYTM